VYSANGLGGSQASPVELRKRLPSNNATITTPNGSVIIHPNLPVTPQHTHAHSHTGPGHIGFPNFAPASIKESDENESEPTMSALLRRGNIVASPEPISPNPSYLGVRPVVSTTPSADSTVRTRKKSAPETPTTPAVTQDLQRPMSMPDMKDQAVRGPVVMVQAADEDEEGDVAIKVQKPTP